MTPNLSASPITSAFEDILSAVRAETRSGRVADYIPELAKADPEVFGISAATVSGHSYSAGDSAVQFTIQSISKPFVYALALADRGVDEVTNHVGVEPSGEAFNAISFDTEGRPANPMINAGALVATSLVRADNGSERFERIRDGLSAFAGRRLEVDANVYRSESDTGDRNRALAALARSYGVMESSVDDAAEPYFQQCALLVDATDLALMGATLANNGLHPLTGEQVISKSIARHTLSIMASCGMYDRSGEWLFRVGLPAKSGVGGGIVAVAPGQYGIGVFSPPLDEAGNSSRGIAVLQALSQAFDLHLFNRRTDAASPIESVVPDATEASITIRVRGEIDFVAGEDLIHEILAALASDPARTVVIDLTSVTRMTTAVVRLMRVLAVDVRSQGFSISGIDPAGYFSD